MYIVTEDEGATVGIREGWNVKKCRPVVKEPSGGTLLFCFALPARGASVTGANGGLTMALCLGAACTGCIEGRLQMRDWTDNFASALPARGASAKADKLRHTIL